MVLCVYSKPRSTNMKRGLLLPEIPGCTLHLVPFLQVCAFLAPPELYCAVQESYSDLVHTLAVASSLLLYQVSPSERLQIGLFH